MAKKLPIVYSALLLTGVNLLLRFVSTSFQVHITARIGPEGVGLLQLVMSVGSLALTAAMAGIRTATMYLTAEELGKKRPQNIKWVLRGCFCYSCVASLTVAAGLYIAAPLVARAWIGNEAVTGAIRLFCLNLPVVCLCGCLTGYFTAANRIQTLAAVEIAEQLCYMVFTLASLNLWGNTPEKACCCVVMGSGVSALFTALCLTVLRSADKQAPGERIAIRKRLLGCAVPLAAADNVKTGINTLENLLVPQRLAQYPGELSPLGAFGRVCGMVFPILMFPAAILFALAELLIPEMARCAAGGERKRIAYLARKSLGIAMVYGFVCAGLLYLLAKPLCLRIYKDPEAGIYLRWYALLAPMLYCDAITDAICKGLGKQRVNVIFNIVTSAMDVALLYLLLPKMGMTGYYISFLVTHGVNLILSLNLLHKTAGISIPFYAPVYTGFGIFLAAKLGGLLRGWPAQTAAFLCLAMLALAALGIIKPRQIRWLIDLLKRPTAKKAPAG